MTMNIFTLLIYIQLLTYRISSTSGKNKDMSQFGPIKVFVKLYFF